MGRSETSIAQTIEAHIDAPSVINTPQEGEGDEDDETMAAKKRDRSHHRQQGKKNEQKERNEKKNREELPIRVDRREKELQRQKDAEEQNKIRKAKEKAERTREEG